MSPTGNRSGDRVARGAITALFLALTLPPAGAAAAGPGGGALRSPDGTAACVVGAGLLSCSNRASQQRSSPFIFTLTAGGGPRVARRTVSWSDRTTVLRAGQTRRLGPFSCRLVDEGLLCSNPTGAAIAASKERLAALLAPAVSP